MYQYQLYWQGSKFIAPEQVERSHFLALKQNHDRVVKFLKACDFQLDGYKVVGQEVLVYKTMYKIAGEQLIPCRAAKQYHEQDEGKGFLICLHLIGYWLADSNWDLITESIRPYLHPILFRALIKYFYFPSWDCK